MAKVLVIDWSQEESLELPEGRYLFKVVDADIGESSKGDQQIVLTLMVMAPKAHKGRKQKVWLTINPKTLRFVRAACEAILGKEMPRSAAKLDVEKFLGKLVYAEAVKNGQYTNIQNWERYAEEDDDVDEEETMDIGEPEEDDEDEADDDDDLSFDEEEEDEEPKPRRR